MITLMEMLRNEKADPAHGRPLDITRIYMANVMSSREAVLLAKKQKLAAARHAAVVHGADGGVRGHRQARARRGAELEVCQRCANGGRAAGPAGDGVPAARGRKRGRRGSPRRKEHLILLRLRGERF